MTNTNTNTTKQQVERDDTQAIQRAVYLDKVSELDKAWKEVDDERAKITKLEIEIAHLKDESALAKQQRDALLIQFQDLYNKHELLIEQCLNTSTALAITTGKLSEGLIKHKFTIPQPNSTNNS